MKKLTRILLSALLLLAVCLSFASCTGGGGAKGNSIDYGARYYHLSYDTTDGCYEKTNAYYEFKSDGTGYYWFDYTSGGSVFSGKQEFLWREAADGAVHLFQTSETYNESHTGYKYALDNCPMYFGEDFFTYTTYGQYGDSTFYFVKEGSALYKKLMGE